MVEHWFCYLSSKSEKGHERVWLITQNVPDRTVSAVKTGARSQDSVN